MCSTWKSCTKYSFGLVKQLLVFVVFSGVVQYSTSCRKYSFGLVKQLLVFVVFSGDVQYLEKLHKVFIRSG